MAGGYREETLPAAVAFKELLAAEVDHFVEQLIACGNDACICLEGLLCPDQFHKLRREIDIGDLQRIRHDNSQAASARRRDDGITRELRLAEQIAPDEIQAIRARELGQSYLHER